MSLLRSQPKGAGFASFGLGLCVFALMPTEIGYQDIASLLARQPGVAERWQNRVFSSVGTIQVATFSFGRPIGTSSPQTATYRLASLDNQGIDITGSVTRNPLTAPPPRYLAADFPKVDRTQKGDRLVTLVEMRERLGDVPLDHLELRPHGLDAMQGGGVGDLPDRVGGRFHRRSRPALGVR